MVRRDDPMVGRKHRNDFAEEVARSTHLISTLYVRRTGARMREMEIEVDMELDPASVLEEEHFRAVLSIRMKAGVGYLEERQLSWVAMDIAPVLKERRHKNGHIWPSSSAFRSFLACYVIDLNGC